MARNRQDVDTGTGLHRQNGDFVRHMRSLRLTSEQLANRLGVSENTVSRWRTGKAKVPGPVSAYMRLLDSLAYAIASEDRVRGK